MLAQSLPIIPPAPKVHAKDLPGWRLLLEFSRNTVSTLPDYAFDALISRRRVLGFDSLLLNDPDGVRHVLTTAMEKYKRLVSTHRVLAPLGGNGLFLAAGSQWRRQRRALAPVFSPANVGILLPHFVAAATGLANTLNSSTRANLALAFQEATLEAV
jgi:cytochrome P450